MIVKGPREKCRSNIEFDSADETTVVNCPHCRQLTHLAIPRPPPPGPGEPKPTAPGRPARRKIVACPDCNHGVSARAYFCPACGAPLAAKPTVLDVVIRVILSVILISLLIAFGGLLMMGLFADHK